MSTQTIQPGPIALVAQRWIETQNAFDSLTEASDIERDALADRWSEDWDRLIFVAAGTPTDDVSETIALLDVARQNLLASAGHHPCDADRLMALALAAALRTLQRLQAA